MLHPLGVKRLEKELWQLAPEFLSGVPQVRISYGEKGWPALNDRQKQALAKALECEVEEIFPELAKGEKAFGAPSLHSMIKPV